MGVANSRKSASGSTLIGSDNGTSSAGGKGSASTLADVIGLVSVIDGAGTPLYNTAPPPPPPPAPTPDPPPPPPAPLPDVNIVSYANDVLMAADGLFTPGQTFDVVGIRLKDAWNGNTPSISLNGYSSFGLYIDNSAGSNATDGYLIYVALDPAAASATDFSSGNPAIAISFNGVSTTDSNYTVFA